jgi:uncharacterized protein (TIGR03084 family)
MEPTTTSLRAEGDDLEALVRPLSDAAWQTATPAPGWTIAHQIGHLQWTDEVALLAVCHPDDFAAVVEQARADPLGLTDEAAAERAALAPVDLLGRWSRGRAALAAALESAPSDQRLPWFGPPMSPRSMATARLMETWAHGLDVADALGVRREPTARLRDIAHLGVRTREFAYRINGLVPPANGVRVELVAPNGEFWAWGPDDAVDRVTGTAEAFCLVVVQRREVTDVDLTAVGDEARRWLSIAQAFAGAPKSVVRAARARGRS